MKREIFRTLLTILLVYTVVHAQDFAFNRINTAGFQDYVAISVPPNPPAGTVRWFQNSATNILQCLRSDGSNCTPVVPVTGAIVFSTTVCPVGFTEYLAGDGRMPLFTLAAHGNVGTTGGSDTLTSTFAGDPMDPHAHQLPLAIDDSNLVTQIAKSSVYGQGPDTHSAVQQLNNSGVTFPDQPSALSESISAGTPTGTNSTEDNRSDFIRLIACIKT